MNYAVVVLSTVFGGSMLYWFLSAKNWFTGPLRNVEVVYGEEKTRNSSDSKLNEKSSGVAQVVGAVELE